MAVINYRPPDTVRAFIKHFKPAQLFADWIIGPVGSGKTTGNFFKLVYMASLQRPSPVDGVRRVRAVIVRNTAPQLQDTTITSWMYWFKHGEAGTWHSTDKRFVLRFADIECEVLFRPLDTPDDVSRVLSLEVTFAVLDEFVQIKKEIVEALGARCGRYPPEKDGGATNWGMWGASNPGNEDDWWYARLYGDAQKGEVGADHYGWSEEDATVHLNERLLAGLSASSTWTYFEQPSGFAPDAENLDNLPGKAAYYTSLAKDKSAAWVSQFIDVQWGYSVSGKPVIATFNPEIHIAKKPLMFNPGLQLVGGMDPGMNTAMIFGQENHFGQLLVTSELITTGYGARRFCSDRLKPHLRQHYPNADFLISPDPAAAQRAQTDERTVVDILKRDFTVKIATMNNRLPGRIDAIEHYSTRVTENGPALLIDPRLAPGLTRALRSGWRYDENTKGDVAYVPKKNKHSHPGDAFSYLCQHFFQGADRSARHKGRKPAPVFKNTYNNR